VERREVEVSLDAARGGVGVVEEFFGEEDEEAVAAEAPGEAFELFGVVSAEGVGPVLMGGRAGEARAFEASVKVVEAVWFGVEGVVEGGERFEAEASVVVVVREGACGGFAEDGDAANGGEGGGDAAGAGGVGEVVGSRFDDDGRWWGRWGGRRGVGVGAAGVVERSGGAFDVFDAWEMGAVASTPAEAGVEEVGFFDGGGEDEGVFSEVFEEGGGAGFLGAEDDGVGERAAVGGCEPSGGEERTLGEAVGERAGGGRVRARDVAARGGGAVVGRSGSARRARRAVHRARALATLRIAATTRSVCSSVRCWWTGMQKSVLASRSDTGWWSMSGWSKTGWCVRLLG